MSAFDYGDGEDGDTLSSSIEDIERGWQNEKLSPDILQCHTDSLEYIIHHIKTIINRLKFLLSNYLRIRLHKIEKFLWYSLERQSLLSSDEFIFAKELSAMTDIHFNELVLQYLPSNFQQLDKKKLCPVPNMKQYVFIRALENVDLDFENGETISLNEGSQMFLPYHLVSNKVGSQLLILI